MKMTEKHREALAIARDRIKCGENAHICFALNYGARGRSSLADPVTELKQEIHGFLTPYGTLGSWQAAHGIRTHLGRRDRLAWIDWMLAQDEL